MSIHSITIGPVALGVMVSSPFGRFATQERRGRTWPDVTTSTWAGVQTQWCEDTGARALRVVLWPLGLLLIWGGE